MKHYCWKCDKEQEYEVAIMKKSRGALNKILKYPLKMAFCKTCGERIYINEIIEENIKEFEKAYEKHTK